MNYSKENLQAGDCVFFRASGIDASMGTLLYKGKETCRVAYFDGEGKVQEIEVSLEDVEGK